MGCRGVNTVEELIVGEEVRDIREQEVIKRGTEGRELTT